MNWPIQGQFFRNDAECIDDLAQFPFVVDVRRPVQRNQTEAGFVDAEARPHVRFESIIKMPAEGIDHQVADKSNLGLALGSVTRCVAGIGE